jgi:osmotically-inducible protein OsmY
MSLLKRCSALFVAALLLSALGCASTSKQESTGEYVDDTVITTRVKTAILNEPSLKVLQINVETYRNVVQLSGFVGTGAEMTRAVELARAVKGVSSVKNDMQLR